jgi:hypothetical protein
MAVTSASDFAAISAIAACIAPVAAIGAVTVSIWQAYFTTRVNALLQWEAKWTSEPMRSTRKQAAASLLAGEEPPNRHVDRVLDFFETLAGIFLKPNPPFDVPIISDDWARHTFYWDAVCYWTKCQSYIATVHKLETSSNAWEDFLKLMPRWIARSGGPPSNDDIDGYLEDERDG